MRGIFVLGLACFLAGIGLSAEEKSSWDPARIAQRLGTTPITLYVEADLKNSPLVEFINSHARAADAVVVSYTDALKESARIGKLGVTRGEVWIYIPDDVDLVHNARKSIEGIDGIVFIPDPLVIEQSRGSLSRKARRVAESAKTLEVRMIAGLESASLRKRANIDDLARHASVFTFYDVRALRRGQLEYRAHVERVAADARKANPDIDIEVAVSTGANDTATRAIVEVLLACADVADRIGIYADESPESRASLELMYRLLRGP
jgi:hypothetical protein